MTDQELESVKYERDILVKLSHPFLAKLHFAFQTVRTFSITNISL